MQNQMNVDNLGLIDITQAGNRDLLRLGARPCVDSLTSRVGRQEIQLVEVNAASRDGIMGAAMVQRISQNRNEIPE